METAVEWLIKQLYDYPIDDIVIKKFEQAKEMEKEQLIKVAMHHRDSSVQRECIELYINNNFNQKQK